jgi:hypothetical protein
LDGQTVFNQGAVSGLELYNTQIILESNGNRYGTISLTANDAYTFRVWGSRFRGGFETKIQGSYADGKYALARTDIEDFEYGLELTGSLSSTFITESGIINNDVGIYFFQGNGATIYNMKFIDNNYMAFFSSSSGTYNFVNFESDTCNFRNIAGCIVNKQNTLNLKIVENGTEIPLENINITVTDKFNTSIFSHLTYPNGTIDEQILSYGYYNQTGGNNIYLYSPHTITLHHNDYQPRKISLNISEKINWKLEVYPTITTTTIYHKPVHEWINKKPIEDDVDINVIIIIGGILLIFIFFWMVIK